MIAPVIDYEGEVNFDWKFYKVFDCFFDIHGSPH